MEGGRQTIEVLGEGPYGADPPACHRHLHFDGFMAARA